jgi:hypothetical protein
VSIESVSPDPHVVGGGLVEQLDAEDGVLEALRRVAEVTVDGGPDQMGTGGQLPGVMLDGPLVHLPDPLGRAGHVARPHVEVGLAEPGARGEQFLAEPSRVVFESHRAVEHGGRVPVDLVFQLEEGSGHLLGV